MTSNDFSNDSLIPAAPPVRERSPLRARLRQLDVKVAPYIYISPFFILFGIFGLFPLGYTAWISLTDRNLLPATTHFVGLDNFSALVHDSYFWNAVENTLAIAFLSTVPQLMLAVLVAYMLNTRMRGRTLFRMSILLPYITSLVAVTLIFKQLFSYNFGLFNYLLNQLGFHSVNWEAGRYTSWFALSAMVTWRWLGYNALIYLAAMQGISNDLYEAAAIDGARRWKQFLHITIPQLRPTIIFTVIVSTIGSLQLFTEPFLFQTIPNSSSGGSARQYQTIVLYLYEKSFGSSQYKLGYAAAIGWCLFLLIIVVGLINLLIVQRIRSAD